MKIEDCKTVPEFFGVNIHDHIWVEGKRFKVYRDALGGEQSAPNEASRALVGCLTGQLKWSTKKPVTAESGGCEWCSDLSRYRGFGYACFFDQIAVDETYELSVEVKYCPNCGRKLLTEPTTEEEIKILREIAAWQNNWEALGLTNNGTIYAISKVDKYYADIPFGNKDKGSKAYEVLAPILEKYGEINLNDYRDTEAEKEEDEPPFGSCDFCGYEFNSELINEYEISHCPKCGEEIEESIDLGW